MGIAILGSVVGAGYIAHLNLSHLSAPAATAARQSVFGGVAVAKALHSTVLVGAVRSAFVQGMHAAFFVSAGIALAGAVLAILFLPKATAPAQPVPATTSRKPVATTTKKSGTSLCPKGRSVGALGDNEPQPLRQREKPNARKIITSVPGLGVEVRVGQRLEHHVACRRLVAYGRSTGFSRWPLGR